MNNQITTMINQARDILSHSYSPYSNYQVAACLVTEDGRFFKGVNVENSVYGLTVCAETAAICQMIAAGDTKIAEIVILNGQGTPCPPCGSCRQFINEFSLKNTVVHLCNHQTIIQSFPINELLPHAFKLSENK